ERSPVVGEDRHLAGRHELARDALLVELRCRRLPSHALYRVRLAETLEQAHTRSIAVETIHVIYHHESITVVVQRTVHAKRRRVPLEPAGVAGDAPERLALRQSGAAGNDEKVKPPLSKGGDELVEVGVGT